MSEVQLLVWLFGIHLVGFILVTVLLLPILRERHNHADADFDSEEGSSDDGWGNLPVTAPMPKGGPGGGVPLPDAVQSPVRFREPGRLSDRLRPAERRPLRDPERTPQRQPTPSR
jgi:hypothetical protein